MEKLMEFFNRADTSPIRISKPQPELSKREYVSSEPDKQSKKINSETSEFPQNSKTPSTDFKKLSEELDAIEHQKKEFLETQLPIRRYQRLVNQYQSIRTELTNLTNKHDGLLKVVSEIGPFDKETAEFDINDKPKPQTSNSIHSDELQSARNQLSKLIRENFELKENLDALSSISRQQQQKLNIYERISNFKIRPLDNNRFEFVMYSENKKWKVEMDISISGGKTTAVVTESNASSEDLYVGSEFTFNSCDNYNFFVMLFIQLNSDLIKFK